MPQSQPESPFNKGAPVDPETARIVPRLDDAIFAVRAGKESGVAAPDSVLDRIAGGIGGGSGKKGGWPRSGQRP
jgi:hypothetical protein